MVLRVIEFQFSSNLGRFGILLSLGVGMGFMTEAQKVSRVQRPNQRPFGR